MMITPKKMNAVGIVVRNLERSLTWYKEKFGFEKLYDVSNGVIIGSNGVDLWVAQADDPDNANVTGTAKSMKSNLVGFPALIKVADL